MELHQLRYFVQVARLESVSKAAQELHVSQPALSKTIAKLEDELGCKLFDRAGKRLRLNDRGRFFLNEVEGVLAGLGSAAAVVGALNSRLGGSVSVGVFGPQADAVACLEQFMAAHPDITVTLDAGQRSATTHVMREFDLVFYPEGPSFSGIEGLAYARNRMLLAMPKTHPLALMPSIDLALFKNEQFIFMNNTAGTYEQMYQLCLSNGFTPRIRAVVSSGMAQMSLVAAGLGVGLCDASGAPLPRMGGARSGNGPQRRAKAEARGIVYAEIKGSTPEQRLCFATRPAALLSASGRALLTHALRYFGLPGDRSSIGRFDRN